MQAIWLGSTVSLALGFLLLMYAAGTGIEGAYFQWHGRRQIDNEPPAGAAEPRRQPVVKPKPGDPLATLDIPRIGLSVVVLEGSSDAVLKRGPGHVEDTAYPGQLGNIAITAHRDTHFRPLRHIRKNDEIVVTTPDGVMRYYVNSTTIVKPTNVEILDPAHSILTLITCYPFDFIGSAPRRFIVVAKPKAPLEARNAIR